MNFHTFLEERVSSPVLEDPAPSPEAMQHAIRAAARAPDHGQLRPWRFLSIEGEARHRLGSLFAEAAQADNPAEGDDALKKLRAMPLRAPLLIVAIAHLQEHPKVPLVEQRISVGAAVMNLMLSLRADGYGCMWRTGPMAYHSAVKQGLGLTDNEEIIGFIYAGTAGGKTKSVSPVAIEQYLKSWQG